MRDLLIVAIVVPVALLALRRPWLGALLWAWLSLMNPHRYAWGFATTAPLAAMAAGCTLLGLLATKDRESPFRGSPPVILAVFMVWITVSWLMGLSPADDYEQWTKVMKIDVMVLVTLALIRTRQQIIAFAWVCALSLALLGAKGGVFTILSGGSFRVWGPPGTFIGDNNEFALALVITIPLLRYLQMQVTRPWHKHGMTLLMIACAAAALGSHSRGGLLSIAAMGGLLWWRSKGKVLGGLVLLSIAIALLAFMPEEWSQRMSTISTYEEDQSAIGRLAAWSVAWNLAFDYPFGVGFNAARPELFAQYSSFPPVGTPVAHSIYFQVLGHHGFVGLFLFALLWISTWRWAAKLRKEAAAIPEARWCADLGAMCQVSLIGYAVGGAFLSLAYFDLPYNVMVLVVAARTWVRRQGWKTEPSVDRWPRWLRFPGVAQPGPLPAEAR